MNDRNPLPAPATAIDMYLHDIAQSLRNLVDLATPAPEPPAADDVTELREPARASKPKRKPSHRDEPREDDDVLRPDQAEQE